MAERRSSPGWVPYRYPSALCGPSCSANWPALGSYIFLLPSCVWSPSNCRWSGSDSDTPQTWFEVLSTVPLQGALAPALRATSFASPCAFFATCPGRVLVVAKVLVEAALGIKGAAGHRHRAQVVERGHVGPAALLAVRRGRAALLVTTLAGAGEAKSRAQSSRSSLTRSARRARSRPSKHTPARSPRLSRTSSRPWATASRRYKRHSRCSKIAPRPWLLLLPSLRRRPPVRHLLAQSFLRVNFHTGSFLTVTFLKAIFLQAIFFQAIILFLLPLFLSVASFQDIADIKLEALSSDMRAEVRRLRAYRPRRHQPPRCRLPVRSSSRSATQRGSNIFTITRFIRMRTFLSPRARRRWHLLDALVPTSALRREQPHARQCLVNRAT